MNFAKQGWQKLRHGVLPAGTPPAGGSAKVPGLRQLADRRDCVTNAFCSYPQPLEKTLETLLKYFNNFLNKIPFILCYD
jgi:hypothetical protein